MRRAALAGALLALALGSATRSARAQEPETETETETPDEPAEHAAEGGGHGEHHEPAEPPPINLYEWHAGKDVNGGERSEGEAAMPPALLFALLNFAVFIGLLVKFAGPKLVGYLRGRHETVRSQLAEAARMRQEARDKLEEYGRRVATLDAQVSQLIAEIRSEAEAEREQILNQARSQAAAMRRDTERRIESEIARARAEIERKVVATAVGAAEGILRQRVTGEDQARLFDGFVDAVVLDPTRDPASKVHAAKVDEEWS